MKNLTLLLRLFLLLLFPLIMACAGGSTHTAKEREVALSTQNMGEEHYRNGDHTAALKSLLEAQKTLPDSPTLHNSLGLVYLAKNRADLAVPHFKKALSLKADYPQARNNLGGAYMKLEQWDKAIAAFEKVADNLLYPTPEMPLSNLGWVHFHQDRYKKARFYFNQALDIRPDFLNAVHGLAAILIQQKKYYRAKDFIQKALEKSPGAAILHADLARTYEGLGNDIKARKAWVVVTKLVPQSSPLAREARRRLADR